MPVFKSYWWLFEWPQNQRCARIYKTEKEKHEILMHDVRKFFWGGTVALIFRKQKRSLIETARAFVDKLSKDTVVSRASKTLEAEIDCMEKGRGHADIINSKVLNSVICLVQ